MSPSLSHICKQKAIWTIKPTGYLRGDVKHIETGSLYIHVMIQILLAQQKDGNTNWMLGENLPLSVRSS